ncbi:MAG: aminoacyl-tRNA hydrolase [Nitrospirae bacterium GWC2_42_7]|nr:MAG: aminoacyl-tRNA hydrolase [Nitrospirae bacterium GWC2_42_7]
MWLIVGLGNPGSRYARTRHNIGFLVLEELASTNKLEFRDRTEFRICKGSIENKDVILLEPLSFMNRSGTPVNKIAAKNGISPDNIIVIHDDLDMETGKLKIRKKGSSGGHRGVESIMQNLGSGDFVRIKIGIGRSEFIPTEEYVLSKFRKEENPLIKDAINKAVESVHSIITEGVEKAMNRYNRT